MDGWTETYLGLGSNLGDRLINLQRAVQLVDGESRLRVDYDNGVASLYETEPVGGAMGQGAYLNTVVRVYSSLSPDELLRVLKRIESRLGRVDGERWGARPIDIDILLYGKVVLLGEGLTIPHPRIAQRCFVLQPLEELAADLRHPEFGRSIRAMIMALPPTATNYAVRRIDSPSWIRADAELALRHT